MRKRGEKKSAEAPNKQHPRRGLSTRYPGGIGSPKGILNHPINNKGQKMSNPKGILNNYY